MTQEQYEVQLEKVNQELDHIYDTMSDLCYFKESVYDRFDSMGMSGTPQYFNAEEAYEKLRMYCNYLKEMINGVNELQLSAMEL